ncbi:hypothetical protein Bca101_059918 [Brassica carinata]
MLLMFDEKATGSSVGHMSCFGDIAGLLQEIAIDAATKVCRLNEEIKGLANLAFRLCH